MARKLQLPKEIQCQVDQERKNSAHFFKESNIEESIRASHRAWNLIPEPKNQWDYYPQSISLSTVKRYVMIGDKENARKWIEIMAEMYNDSNHEDHLVLMTEGDAMYKLGDLDRAYYVFNRIFEIYGREGFQGEQLEYWKFYQAEKAARGAD